MPSENLFEEEKGNSLTKVYVGVGLIVLVIVGVVAFFAFRANQDRVAIAKDAKFEAATRDTTINMLSHIKFSSDEFRQQVLGKGRLERYERVNEDLYFTYPPASQEEFDEFADKFFIDKKKFEWAKEEDGKLTLGGYSAIIRDEKLYFFRTNLKNFKVDSSQMLTFPFNTVNYTISLKETKDFLEDKQVYGGNLAADASSRSIDPMILIANHGIMVGKPNEPSLQRLVQELLKDVEDNREKKIQRLVDFVSNEIAYSYTEALGGGETLKRPNEILMTREGDCSNKTILLASLLEQIGEDYLMVYCPKHITVAVPQGNFQNDNKMDIQWENKNWLIAETTLPGFQVGTTKVQDFNKITPINYVQRPKEKNKIFDASSMKVLEFR